MQFEFIIEHWPNCAVQQYFAENNFIPFKRRWMKTKAKTREWKVNRQKRPEISAWQIYAVHNALRYKIHSNQSHILRCSLVFCRSFSLLSLFCCAWLWFRWFFFLLQACAYSTDNITYICNYNVTLASVNVFVFSVPMCKEKKQKYWYRLRNKFE